MKFSYELGSSRHYFLSAFSAFLLFSLSACVVYVPEGERRATQATASLPSTYYYDVSYMFVDDWGYPLAYVPISINILDYRTQQWRWVYGLTDDRGICRFNFASGDYGVIYVNYMDRAVYYPAHYRTNLFFNVLIIDFNVPQHSHAKRPLEYKFRGDRKDRRYERHGSDDLSVGIEHSKMGRDFYDVYESYDDGKYNQSRSKGSAFIKKYSKSAPKEYLDEVDYIVKDSEKFSKESKLKDSASEKAKGKEEKERRRYEVMNTPVSGATVSKSRKTDASVGKDVGKGKPQLEPVVKEKGKEVEKGVEVERGRGLEVDKGKEVDVDMGRPADKAAPPVYKGVETERGRPVFVPRSNEREERETNPRRNFNDKKGGVKVEEPSPVKPQTPGEDTSKPEEKETKHDIEDKKGGDIVVEPSSEKPPVNVDNTKGKRGKFVAPVKGKAVTEDKGKVNAPAGNAEAGDKDKSEDAKDEVKPETTDEPTGKTKNKRDR